MNQTDDKLAAIVARVQNVYLDADVLALCAAIEAERAERIKLAEAHNRMVDERDAALAEVERLLKEIGMVEHAGRLAIETGKAVNEIERLQRKGDATAERDAARRERDDYKRQVQDALYTAGVEREKALEWFAAKCNAEAERDDDRSARLKAQESLCQLTAHRNQCVADLKQEVADRLEDARDYMASRKTLEAERDAARKVARELAARCPTCQGTGVSNLNASEVTFESTYEPCPVCGPLRAASPWLGKEADNGDV